MAGRGVGQRRVGASVPAAAAPVSVHRGIEAQVEPKPVRHARLERDVHQQGVACGVGDVVGGELPLAVPGGCRNATRHASAAGKRCDRVRRVAPLHVGERRAVGDDVPQRLDVRVVDRRVVDVAEDAAGHRVPDLRGRVPRGAEAVLAREVEVRERAGRPLRIGDRDRQEVGRRVVAERDLCVVGGDRERDVGSVRGPARAVVLVPALVDGDLRLV